MWAASVLQVSGFRGPNPGGSVWQRGVSFKRHWRKVEDCGWDPASASREQQSRWVKAWVNSFCCVIWWLMSAPLVLQVSKWCWTSVNRKSQETGVRTSQPQYAYKPASLLVLLNLSSQWRWISDFFHSIHCGSGWSRGWQGLPSVTQTQRIQKR